MTFPVFLLTVIILSLKAGSSQGKVGVAVDTEAPAVWPANGVTCPNSEAVEAVSQTNQATWQTNETLDTASVTHESRNCLSIHLLDLLCFTDSISISGLLEEKH